MGEADEDDDAITARILAGRVVVEIGLPVVDGPDVPGLIDHDGRLTHHRDEAGRRWGPTVQRLAIVQKHFVARRRHRIPGVRRDRVAYAATRRRMDAPELRQPACEIAPRFFTVTLFDLTGCRLRITPSGQVAPRLAPPPSPLSLSPNPPPRRSSGLAYWCLREVPDSAIAPARPVTHSSSKRRLNASVA